MLTTYTYLLINFCTVVICFIFSFDKRIRFNQQFAPFLKAVVVVSTPFILWDVWFTQMGVWWFNKTYTIGLNLAGLPLEEWLFFVCIPFACLFTYYCLDTFFDWSWAKSFNTVVSFISCIIGMVVALLSYDKTYTLVTALAIVFTMLYLYFIAKVPWIGQATFVYIFLLLGFFPVNGILTGTGLASPVVNYNPMEFSNVRILTIPLEDFAYGYTQFLLNIYFFKLFQKRT